MNMRAPVPGIQTSVSGGHAPPPSVTAGIGREIELKMLVAKPDELDNIAAAPILHGHVLDHKKRRLTSVYYDTPDRALRKDGFTLRVRDDGDGYVMTVKSSADSASDELLRGEWECAVSSQDVDRIRLQGLLPADVLERIGEAALEPLFTTEIDREQTTLSFSSSIIEVAIDRGRVVSGDKTEPVAEVELELKAGATAALYQLALALGQSGVLMPSSRAKADRGFDLALGSKPTALKACQPDLSPRQPLDESFAAIFASVLTHLVGNLHFAGDSDSPEGVHQARVALRRVRAAFDLVKRTSGSPRIESLRAEAKRLEAALGDARDWDVFATETVPSILSKSVSVNGYDDLRGTAATARREAHQKGRLATTDEHVARFLLELGLWARQRGWRGDATPEGLAQLSKPTRRFAVDVLGALHRKAIKRGRHFDHLAADQRHQLRIALKKLRYVADFLLPVVGKTKQMKRYAQALARLQDTLGRFNDIARTPGLIGELKHRQELAHPNGAIAAILASQAAELEHGEKGLRHRWHQFARTAVPWA
ncbi:CHAD domain-containing protein [Mesorhizobium sp.]|uniref:CYTH and CHAD domain-containing protein n=1 Tax=Mesorhizobium sp. TaxID=1871066 RepID=UPI003BADB05C